jgi:hypothetical protein
MNLEDVPRLEGATINVGDHYVGQRNGPARLLTALIVHDDGYIIPEEVAYPYSLYECVKVSPQTYVSLREQAEREYAAWYDLHFKGAGCGNQA